MKIMIGILQKKKISLNNGKEIYLKFIDTPNQESLRSMTLSSTRYADCTVFGFDLTRSTSFENIKYYWYPDYFKYNDSKCLNI